MAEPHRENDSGRSYWNLKFDPNTWRGFLDWFCCSALFRCAVWLPFLPSYYFRNFLPNWPVGLYLRQENEAVQLLKNLLLVHLHTYGASPSSMTVQALVSVHTQLPELSRAAPVAEGTSANKHLQINICKLGSLLLRNWEWFIHYIG